MDIRECSALGKYSRCVASSLDNHRWSHSHSVCLCGSWFDTWHSSSVFVWSDQRIFSSPSGAFLANSRWAVFHLLQSHFCGVTLPCRPNSCSAAEMVVLCKVLLELCQRDHQVSVPCLTKALVPWLLRLAGRPPLGRVQVVPNFFHGGQCANWELQAATSFFMYRSPFYFSRAHSACWCHFVCCKLKCTEASARWWLHQSA